MELFCACLCRTSSGACDTSVRIGIGAGRVAATPLESAAAVLARAVS